MYLVALSLVMVVIMAFAVISITPPTTSDNKDATDLDQDMGTCGDGADLGLLMVHHLYLLH